MNNLNKRRTRRVCLSSARQAAAALLGLALAQPTAAAEHPVADYAQLAASDFVTVAHANGGIITDDARRRRADRLAKFSGPLTLILQCVRQHYFERPNEQKMLSAAIDAMGRISPAVPKVSARGGALSLDAVYEAAQEAFNERATADDDALLRAGAKAASPAQFHEGGEGPNPQSVLPPAGDHDKVLQVAFDLLRNDAPHK